MIDEILHAHQKAQGQGQAAPDALPALEGGDALGRQFDEPAGLQPPFCVQKRVPFHQPDLAQTPVLSGLQQSVDTDHGRLVRQQYTGGLGKTHAVSPYEHSDAAIGPGQTAQTRGGIAIPGAFFHAPAPVFRRPRRGCSCALPQ